MLLQHPDGRVALDRGDVDAWDGRDPMMAAAELDNNDALFYRDRAANTYGVLDVREAFSNKHPGAVQKILDGYREARRWSLAHPAEFKALIVKTTGLSAAVIDRRTDITTSKIGALQRESILATGKALQKAGVVPETTDARRLGMRFLALWSGGHLKSLAEKTLYLGIVHQARPCCFL